MTVRAIVDDDNADLFGKEASDLQEDIVVGDDAITGTLKYVADYSSAFGSGLDSGNYIALHIDVPNKEGVTYKAGADNPSPLDETGDVIIRITDKDSQTVKIVASREGDDADAVKEYDLTGLTLLGSI